MKNFKEILLLLSISLLIILPKIQFAQWITVYDDGKYYIVGIEFKDENTGFAGGFNMESDSAVIIRTTDGGDNWEEIFALPGGYAGPYCFDFINDTLAISGGQDGTIYKSSDGGNNWEYISSIGGLNDIFTIRFFNETIGLASGMRTTDGGYTWTWMDIGITSDIFLVDDLSGFATSWDGIFYTSDFGESWLKVSPDPEEQYNSVCMATDLVGYAAKNPDKIYKTTDGGMSWFLIDSLSVYEIKQIRFTDENTGYILVNNGSMRVMRTTDGGNTWDYVLFGNEYSYQMAFASEETILVPTINGMMYKTNNGGGTGISPKHTEIDWVSQISGPLEYSYLNIRDVTIDSYSNIYLSGWFHDSLFFNGSQVLVSINPDKTSTYIVKYDPLGNIPWFKAIEDPVNSYSGQTIGIDMDNDVYITYFKSGTEGLQIQKLSQNGDSIWTKTLNFSGYLNDLSFHAGMNEHLYLSGSFDISLEYANQIIQSDHKAIFILELDQNGNLVYLKKIVEVLYNIAFNNMDVNSQGSICLSFQGFGPAFINSDTLGYSYYHLMYMDSDYNLLWYNNEFDHYPESISNLIFNNDSRILLTGNELIDDEYFQLIIEYDDQGNKMNSKIIDGGIFTGAKTLCHGTNGTIITGGRYEDYAIIDNDTLFGFDYLNSFIYTLNDDLELIRSSHISGANNIEGILVHQNNSYLIEKTDFHHVVIFGNDTLFVNDNDHYFVAKLNSNISSVAENISHSRLLVYPNPTTGMFSVILPEGSPNTGLIEIYSINGQKIYETSLSIRNNRIDLSKLNKGIYFIQLSHKGNIYSQKIIIQ